MFGPHDVWALLAFSSNTLVRSVEIVFGFHSDLENSSFNLCAPTEAYWCEEDGQIWTSKVLENELQVGLCYFELVVDLHVSSVLCHMMPLDSHRLCKPRKERNLWKQNCPLCWFGFWSNVWQTKSGMIWAYWGDELQQSTKCWAIVQQFAQ